MVFVVGVVGRGDGGVRPRETTGILREATAGTQRECNCAFRSRGTHVVADLECRSPRCPRGRPQSDNNNKNLINHNQRSQEQQKQRCMCDLWMVGGVRGGAVGGRVLAGAWVTFGLWAGGGRWDGVRGVAVGGVGVGVGAGFVVAFSSHCAWRSLWYAKNSSARSSQSASPRRALPQKGLSASLVGRGEESRSSHRVPFSPPRAVGCDGRPRRACGHHPPSRGHVESTVASALGGGVPSTGVPTGSTGGPTGVPTGSTVSTGSAIISLVTAA